MKSRTLLGTLAAAAVLSVALPAQAAWRTFVSPTGIDVITANSCGLATPCRQFVAALTITAGTMLH
jgi:hypothetical protein